MVTVRRHGLKPLFVYEMANNHMGDVAHGKELIHALKEVSNAFPFDFAVKFQYRELDTFIHPQYKERMDLKYIKRFQETRLTESQFLELKSEIEKVGFLSICTPFDEPSVDAIVKHKYSYLKVASCSLTDWPLLEKIAATDMPIIASTAGSSIDDIDRVVSFMVHRNKHLTLMHCVASYPTKNSGLQLNQIDLLKARYPGIQVGYSTHEAPDNFSAVQMAVAKGARVFEKHVGLKTDKYAVNEYSATPNQVRDWLKAAHEAFEICGTEGHRYDFSAQELNDLKGLRRGVFLKTSVKKGQKIDNSNVFFAIPSIDGQMQANDFSKYKEIYAESDLNPEAPVLTKEIKVQDKREKVYQIVQRVKSLLKEANVVVGSRLDLEISHHYGIEKFDQTGITMINYINRDYCKKVIAVLPGQSHPEQFHKIKEETFHILYGDVQMQLDAEKLNLKQGDIVTIERGMKHAFSSTNGAVIEEISSTHIANDSFYTDEFINKNPSRKTVLTHWMG